LIDIKNNLIFHSGKKHYVLCADEVGLSRLNPLKEILTKRALSFEEIHLERRCSLEVDDLLGKQKMGTYLYVAAERERLREVLFTANKLGYSSQEAQFLRVGEEEKRMFCCKCHFIFRLENTVNTGEYINCTACSLKLEVSDYYSPLKDAYLGYVAEV
jgi:dimethylamine monooxygenase subunit C